MDVILLLIVYKMKTNKREEKESLKHCLTVLDCFLDETNDYQDAEEFDKADKKWAQAEKYLLDWIEENYIPREDVEKEKEKIIEAIAKGEGWEESEVHYKKLLLRK